MQAFYFRQRSAACSTSFATRRHHCRRHRSLRRWAHRRARWAQVYPKRTRDLQFEIRRCGSGMNRSAGIVGASRSVLGVVVALVL